jgi:beta-galactosidase
MKNLVTLRAKQILVDGKPRFLRSAEIQYFRSNRANWPELIQAAVEGGHNCIASYIPWQWHEPEKDRFDFTGENLPERDLVSFLNLVRDAGLYFFARLGPFINAELVRGGHPLWLFERYPHLQSRDTSGRYAHRENDGDLVPSQLHPEYLELVFRWYERAVEAIRPYSIENGGPIIMLQVDNEPNLVFTYSVEGSLYDEHVLEREGLWARWLEETHGSELEKRYEMKSLNELDPPRTGKTSTLSEYRLTSDWLRFKKWHIFEYIRRLAENVRGQGLDLPFTMNEPVNRYWPWNSGDHASFALYMKDKGLAIFSSGHCYLRYGGEQNQNGVPVTLARLESVKMSSLPGPPSVYELGSWFTLPSSTLGSYNWDIMVKLLIGSGMNGYSVYVYNDGESYPGYGKVASAYNWRTAIGPGGKRNTPYRILRQINTFIESWETEILKAEKLFDVTIALSDELPMIANNVELPDNFLSLPLNPNDLARDVNQSVTELCRVLTHLSVNFEFMSLDSPNRSPGSATKLLIVPNNGSLSQKGAAFIEQHLSSGGDVVFYPFVPMVDCDGIRLNRLEETVTQRITGALPRGGQTAGDMVYRIIDGEREREVGIDSPLLYFDAPQGSTVLASHNGKPSAYRVQARGGNATVMGFLPVFFTEATQKLFEELLVKSNGLRRVAFSSDGSVFVAARSSNRGTTLLAAATILGEDAATKLHLHLGADELILPASGNLEMRAKEARFLWVNLSLPEGKLLYTTSQVARGSTPGEYLVSGAPGTSGQMALDRSLRALVEGHERKLVREGNAWVLTYEHGRKPLSVLLKA